MKRTVAKVIHKGTYRVVFDDKEQEYPYTIYYEWYDCGKHSKKISMHRELYYCMHRIADEVIQEEPSLR